MPLHYAHQLIDESDIAAVNAVLRSDWLTTGPVTEQFEEAFAKKVGARHAIACSSGTAALHLSCLALGLGPGTASVAPTITFLATANATRFVGGDVLFADVNPETGLLRLEDLHKTLDLAKDHEVRALFVVHLNGQTAPTEELARLARRHGLAVVEDGCHALGTTYRTSGGGDGQVGDCLFSDLTVFSFHPIKTIVMGEGGAVTTNDSTLAASLRSLRNHGLVHGPEGFVNTESAFDSSGAVNPWYHEMQALGFNYRASDIHCALGLSQLAKLDEFSARRRTLMRLYDEQLRSLAPQVSPVPRVPGCNPTLHLYPVLIDFDYAGITRAHVMNRLKARGIHTQVHYYPVHRQPYYAGLYGDRDMPGARAYYERVLSLPFHAGLKDDDVPRVVGALREVLAG